MSALLIQILWHQQADKVVANSSAIVNLLTHVMFTKKSWAEWKIGDIKLVNFCIDLNKTNNGLQQEVCLLKGSRPV